MPSFSIVFYYFRIKAIRNPNIDKLYRFYLTPIAHFEVFMMWLFGFTLKYQHEACKAFCSHKRITEALQISRNCFKLFH